MFAIKNSGFWKKYLQKLLKDPLDIKNREINYSHKINCFIKLVILSHKKNKVID